MEKIKNFLKSRELLAGLMGLVLGLGLGILLCAPYRGSDAVQMETTVPTPPGSTTQIVTTAAPTTAPTTVPATVPTTAPQIPTGPQPLVHHVTRNHFRAEDFAYTESGYITCLEAESWLGIDVSAHQKVIDWQQVADAGIQFAIIRIAYRGWGSEGILRQDNYAMANLEGAAAVGIKVGVYIYSQAITVEEAIEEAQLVLTLLDGRALDMPVVFDWEQPSEDEARTKNMDSEVLNACALAFCKTIEDAGYTPMIYFNQRQAKYQYDLTTIQKAGYGFWLAMYSDALTYTHHVKMWQYTSSGSVPGINGRVDMDLYFPGL